MGQEEWLELESDPGLFTLLVEDLGVRGVQVEEIYDLSKAPTDPVFGFIFLFRWQQNNGKKNSRRCSRGTGSLNTSQASSTGGAEFSLITSPNTKSRTSNENVSTAIPNSHSSSFSSTSSSPEETIFFAQQVVPNSCATHSLLSILLNVRANQGFSLGHLLNEFRSATTRVSPRVRGLAIGYMPPLVEAHNRHARQPIKPKVAPPCGSGDGGVEKELLPGTCVRQAVEAAKRVVELENNSTAQSESSATLVSSTTTSTESDTFHFVCFLPVGEYLFELDGLKKGPVNHGPLEDPVGHVGWTQQCLALLQQRMEDQDLRYNLMAVVPDRRLVLSSRLDKLRKNRSILAKTIQQLTSSNSTAVEIKLEPQRHNQLDNSHDEEGRGCRDVEMKTEDRLAIESVGEFRASFEDPQLKKSEPAEEPAEEDCSVLEVVGKAGESETLLAEDASSDADGRPLTRAATRAATASRVSSSYSQKPSSSASSSSLHRQSLPTPSSICIDLTENDVSATIPPTNNKNGIFTTAGETPNEFKGETIGVTTRRRANREPGDTEQQQHLQHLQRQSKYPTRSSTRRDTLASHALANTRTYCPTQQQRQQSHAALSSPESSEQKPRPMTTAFLTTDDLQQLLEGIDDQAKVCSAALAEEEAKRHAYRVDSARRTHDYEPFIRAFLTELSRHDMLQPLLANEAAPRQLRNRRSKPSVSTSTTPPKKETWDGAWLSSSTVSTSSSSTTSSTPTKKASLPKQNHGGDVMSRAVVKKAWMTAAGASVRSRRKHRGAVVLQHQQRDGPPQRPETRMLSSGRRSSTSTASRRS